MKIIVWRLQVRRAHKEQLKEQISIIIRIYDSLCHLLDSKHAM